MKRSLPFSIRIIITAIGLTLTCLIIFISCQQGPKQGDNNMQYFFSGKVLEAEDEYLLIEVIDTGNTNLSMNEKVEVSTDSCPDIDVGAYAKVLMEKNIDKSSTDRLEALSIYEVDENGRIVTD